MSLARGGWVERGIHVCKFHPLLENQPAGPKWILPTANAAYSRTVWEKAGPFRGDVFSGDAILTWNARRAGYDAWFEPKAVVAHYHTSDIGAFIKERLRRGAEFGKERAQYEGWPRSRCMIRIAAAPFLAVLVLFRAAADTARSGQFATYAATFPIQVIGHFAWAAGEVAGFWRAS
jgi:GT2 family glycosyltransferase